MTTQERPYRPAPDMAMLTGALAALAGYLLPWFRVGESYRWWYSGWEYATLSTGGGWTLLTIPAWSWRSSPVCGPAVRWRRR
ncbi:hypothetical protein [Polymorphospora rubra]|uniref:hypothetical protein n=1 Tax=Polymorphospora rubra TaxID=338584 RepID=UPI0033E9664F